MTQPDSIPREWIDTARIAFETALAEETGGEIGEVTAEERVQQQTIFAKVIAALRPLIEAETRERCAAVAGAREPPRDATDVSWRRGFSDAADEIASALRAEGK